MKTLTLSLSLLLVLTGTIRAQKANDWRPENRTGVSSETGLMKSWPEAGPTMLWSNLELGSGYSSPSFGNKVIYITGTKDTADILYALSME
ncbi:MAG: polyvinylalcohol dehydrogenase, partial [Bacteroidales bacterium]|nr:polyvinylalcohol dehydrogenase [Bacteroidales bacterium]